jgi:hypothetical protein
MQSPRERGLKLRWPDARAAARCLPPQPRGHSSRRTVSSHSPDRSPIRGGHMQPYPRRACRCGTSSLHHAAIGPSYAQALGVVEAMSRHATSPCRSVVAQHRPHRVASEVRQPRHLARRCHSALFCRGFVGAIGVHSISVRDTLTIAIRSIPRDAPSIIATKSHHPETIAIRFLTSRCACAPRLKSRTGDARILPRDPRPDPIPPVRARRSRVPRYFQ